MEQGPQGAVLMLGDAEIERLRTSGELAQIIERMRLRRPGDPSSHPEWRDEEAALISTKPPKIDRAAEPEP